MSETEKISPSVEQDKVAAEVAAPVPKESVDSAAVGETREVRLMTSRRPETTLASSVEALKETIGGSAVKKNAFAELVRGWEAYLNDHDGDVFPPMQMLHHLQLCGPARYMPAPRLTGPGSEDSHLLAPPALRHTHSSPLQSRSSLLGNVEDDDVPPPVPLDPFQRSSSTPSSFRRTSFSSAFESVDSSAFTKMPPSRLDYAASMNPPGSRYSAFNPVAYYEQAFDDMERTSIEVMDMGFDKSDSDDQELKKLGAASRAARFLSDVRLRRRRRFRGSRDKQQKPGMSTVQENESSGVPQRDTSVTVITEQDAESPVGAATESKAEAPPSTAATPDGEIYSPPVHESDVDEDKEDEPSGSVYHQLESDHEEDNNGTFQRIETSIQESPPTVPSSYQKFDDDRAEGEKTPVESQSSKSLKIKISDSTDKLSKVLGPVQTPSPTQMSQGAVSVAARSEDSTATSPGTRSANTGSSSGHTTQATSFTAASQTLSTISETDREVMEANKQGKKRRSLESLPVGTKPENDGTSIHSSSTNSTNPAGYLALDGSPVVLRDGANVPADRFFTNSPSVSGSVHLHRSLHSASSRRSGGTQSTSPGTESASAANTSSTSSSSNDPPPTFVSYLDKQPSELTSVREASEISSPRASSVDREEREGSPAEMLGYPSVIFQEALVPVDKQKVPVAVKYYKSRAEKLRSRPPRSPVKGGRPPMTPPPRSSPSPIAYRLSPPPNIVDHPDSNISRPYVMRKLMSSSDSIPEAYAETSIEILKSDSSAAPKIVTPEKED